MRKFLLVLILILIPNVCFAKHSNPEKYYQRIWCNANHGTMEYVLKDDARVDCLTKDYAIEFDFAPKWAESIGQALYYGMSTNRQPGVVLIMGKNSAKYLKRLNTVASKHGIVVWTMRE